MEEVPGRRPSRPSPARRGRRTAQAGTERRNPIRQVLTAWAVILFIVAGNRIALAAPGPAAGERPESRARRFETVFVISLPFTALYSGLAVLGAATVIEVGIKHDSLKVSRGYQVAGGVMALAGAAWIAWRDIKARPAAEPRGSPGLESGIEYPVAKKRENDCRGSSAG